MPQSQTCQPSFWRDAQEFHLEVRRGEHRPSCAVADLCVGKAWWLAVATKWAMKPLLFVELVASFVTSLVQLSMDPTSLYIMVTGSVVQANQKCYTFTELFHLVSTGSEQLYPQSSLSYRSRGQSGVRRHYPSNSTLEYSRPLRLVPLQDYRIASTVAVGRSRPNFFSEAKDDGGN